MNQIIKDVEKWQRLVGIIGGVSVKNQLLKIREEIEEVELECTTGNQLEQLEIELGDLMIAVLGLTFQTLNDPKKCIEKALKKNKKRKIKVMYGQYFRED